MIEHSINKDDLVKQQTVTYRFQQYTQSKSQYQQAYLERLKISQVKKLCDSDISRFVKNAQSENVKIDLHNFLMPSIYFKSLNASDIILAVIDMGFIHTEVCIYNTVETFPFNHSLAINNGEFGDIFLCQFFGEILIGKFCKYKSHLNVQANIINVIKQYAITKIASVFQFGPTVTNKYGVQIFCFSDGVLFFMERLIEQKKLQDKLSLDQSLYFMHRLHFVHNDIKPSNIGFSQILNNLVFMDFGLSDIIQEDIGCKTLTVFKGSLMFCGAEMEKCFTSPTELEVDMYYNDFQCLEKSFQSQKNQIFNFFEHNIYESFLIFNAQRAFMVSLFKFNIFTSNFPRLRPLLKFDDSYILHHYSQNVIDILLSHSTNNQLKRLINQDLKILEHDENYHKLKSKFCYKNTIWVESQRIKNSQQTSKDSQFTFNLYIYFNSKDSRFSSSFPFSYDSFISKHEEYQNYFSNDFVMKIYAQLIFTRQNEPLITWKEREEIIKIFARKFNLKSSECPFENYRLCLYYLLSHFLMRKDEKSFLTLRLIYDNILVNNNIVELFSQIESYCCDQKYKTIDKFCISIEIQGYITLLIHKLHSNSFLFLKNAVCFFKKLSQKLLAICILQSQIVKQYFEMINKKIRQIKSNLKVSVYSRQELNRLLLSFMPLQQKAGDNRLRNMLNSFVIVKFMDIFLECDQTATCIIIFQAASAIKSNIFGKNTVKIKFGFTSIYNISFAIQNRFMIRRIAQTIRQQYHYREIYQNFQFQMHDFLFSESKDTVKLQKYFNCFVECYRNQDTSIRYVQFAEMCKKIENNSLFKQTNRHLIDDFISHLLQSKVRNVSVKSTNELISFYIQFTNIVFALSKLYPGLHIRIQQLLLLIKKEIDPNNPLEVLKCEGISAANNLALKKYDQSYQSYKKILQFALEIGKITTIESTYKNIILLFYLRGNKEMVYFYVNEYLNFCYKIDNFFGYFFDKSIRMIFITIQSLVIAKEIQKSYNFMEKIAINITENINKQHFQQWTDSLTFIFSKYPQLFTLSNFTTYISTKISWINVYIIVYCVFSLQFHHKQQQLAIKIMIVIAKKISELKSFAKEFIFQTYYSTFLDLNYLCLRKKMVIYQKQLSYISKSQSCNYYKIVKKKIQQIGKQKNILIAKQLKRCLKKKIK